MTARRRAGRQVLAAFALWTLALAGVAHAPAQDASSPAAAVSGSFTAAPALEEAVEQIMAGMPGGPGTAQAAWLFAEARRHKDARLAYALTEEILERAEGSLLIDVRLWRVRYWMAAGETGQAAREVEAIDRRPDDAGGEAELRFWRAVLGEAVESPEAGVHQSPPWDLLAQIALVRENEADRGQVRFALSLEGEARRWGLLGLWLWHLEHSGLEPLGRAAREIGATVGGALAAAPERAFLGGTRRRSEEQPAQGMEPGPVAAPEATSWGSVR